MNRYWYICGKYEEVWLPRVQHIVSSHMLGDAMVHVYYRTYSNGDDIDISKEMVLNDNEKMSKYII
jgi:hypothetical protein